MTPDTRPAIEARERIARGWAMRTGICMTCQDDFGPDRLTDGECEYCRNRKAGLCECGNEPEAGGKCGPCMEDQRADELYHAQF